MLKKIYAAILVAIIAGNFAIAQTGALKGKAIDETNGEGLSFANVQLEQGGNAVAKTVADIDGNFTIKPIPPGTYDVKVASVGYQTYFSKGVVIGGDKTTYIDAKVKSTAIEKDAVIIVEYKEPIIDPDYKSGGIVTRDEFQAMASKNINSVASTTAGVFQRDEGDGLNIRGGRTQESGSRDFSGTTYYIDGEKARGSAGLPQSSIEQISVITGGIPASLGDATGGFINITTRGGVRNDFFGGVELISSQLTDAYGYNFAGLNAGGPLMSKKDSAGNKQAKLGFFLSADVSTEKDPDPSAVGIYKVKDEKQKELEEAPLAIDPETGGTLLNAEYLRMEDLEHIKARQNVRQNIFRLAGKMDFKATDDITFTLGGSMDYNNHRAFIYEYSLINPNGNYQQIENAMRMYGKITHKLGKDQSKDDKTTSLVQNAYYTLQAGYTKYKETRQSAVLKDDIFKYGHIGKFETKKAPNFQAVTDTNGNIVYYNQIAWSDTQVVYTAGDANPLASVYTDQFYELVPGEPNTLSDIQLGYGLINGDRPRNIYSIWYNVGRTNNQHYNIDQAQFRVTGQFSADIKNHAIQAGFEYEKRNDKYWEINPITLWTLMRQYTNKHITQLDNNDSTIVSGPILVGSTVINPAYSAYTHPYIINSSEQSQFDKSLRESLGKGAGEWIDIDSYDPGTFSLNMFSPDELFSDGNSLIAYYGYSYDGKKLSGKPAFDMAALESFYKGKDANDNYSRVIPSFQPVYTAGYIQDKFDIKDMKFNVGLRLDHFNANQPVLIDKYLLYETNTVADVPGSLNASGSHPANIGNGYAVYVDDAKSSTPTILGYRNGDIWYNADGTIISDPAIITPSAGVIQPYLKYPSEKFLDSSKVENIFKMYDAQVTFMPRIAFAFPISDRANFFAHYDVLTQRPPSRLRFRPTDYLFIYSQGALLNNPDLKPERTTDYEIGFSQVLNERKNAALTLSAFYREMRDMIQQINVVGAYPNQYSSFGNIDFGTVKGFSVAYDLRRTNSVQMTASYTLQFAEGTGSAATDAGGILEFGQPNLRTTMPLDFDQRHAIVLNTDYRFGTGKDYRGPQAKWAKMIFENFGGNMVLRAGSGLPYTRQENVTSGNGDNSSAVIFTINQRSTMKGSLNGSNLPWQYRMDIRLDKNIPLLFGKKGEGEDKRKTSNLNVYVQILNVLNTKNVINLYRYTGDPDDDGYLSAPENQLGFESYLDPQSFRDMYASKISNPSHYSIPRRIRIGIVLDF